MSGFILFMLMITILLGAATEDLTEKKVSIFMLIAVAVSMIAYGLTQVDISIVNRLIGMAPGAVLVLGSFIFKKSLGLADGILVLVGGFAFGMMGVTTVLCFSFFALLAYAIAAFFVRRWRRSDRIAFFPFFLIGLTVVMFP